MIENKGSLNTANHSRGRLLSRRSMSAGVCYLKTRWPEAVREAEELFAQFVVLYPNEAIVRTALRGAAAHQLSWYAARLWAYAEHYGLSELYSEDFEHDRLYGTVRAVNTFLA